MPTRSQRVDRLDRRAVRYQKFCNQRRLFDLLERHPEIGTSCGESRSFLERAFGWSDYELLEWLLAYGTNPDRSEAGENAPLIPSAVANDLRLAKLLLVAGANVEKANAQEETPLGFACVSDAIDMVRLLCESGANVNRLEGREKWHYLFGVRCAGQNEIERILIEFGADCAFQPPPREAIRIPDTTQEPVPPVVRSGEAPRFAPSPDNPRTRRRRRRKGA